MGAVSKDVSVKMDGVKLWLFLAGESEGRMIRDREQQLLQEGP